MPVPVVLALLAAALLSLVALVWMVRVLVTRFFALSRDLDYLVDEVGPALDALRSEVAVTAAEYEAVGDRLAAAAAQRRTRPRRRWRPPPAR